MLAIKKDGMNILMVYPKYPDTFWSFKHALRYISKKAAFPPLGLLTVAALLPKEWNKKLVDQNVGELKDEHIAWADLIFISAMIVQKESTKEIIKRCQGKVIVAGGPLFTTNTDTFEGISHFILNEAEVTLPMFLDDFKKGKLQKVYTSSIRPEITRTPVPMWDLIDPDDYAAMSLQYSRGCPFDCEFCDITIMNGRIPRTKTPDQVIAELQSIYDMGWRGNVFIVDDNFIGNKAKAKELLPRIMRWQKLHKYPFVFQTEASTDLADDPDLMQMMSAANFNSVFLGLETPCVESLKECNKMQNTKRSLAEAVKTIQQNGMQVTAGFIVGFDSDRENIFEIQIDFIQQIGVVTAMVGLLNALPQTRLWHRLKSEGRLLRETTGENTDGSINFLPKMQTEKLIEGYKKILSKIYAPRSYYKRIGTFIRNYNPTAKKRFTKRDISAFLKSVWKIGILSRSRLLYWKLLIVTGLTKRQAFPTAIELAIYGKHFEKVTQKILDI